MTWRRFSVFLFSALFLASSSGVLAVTPGITLLGKGEVAGNSLDKSGLRGNICSASDSSNCVPRAILGGFGSALTYTGFDNVFVATPDRGPFDGLTDVPYLNRFDVFKITTNLNAQTVKVTLLDTRFLRNEFGQTFVGGTGAFNTHSERLTLRLDPEGIRLGLLGTMFVSDEYGPYVLEFLPNGQLLRRIDVPQKFALPDPDPRADPPVPGASADANVELHNPSGRQANRGMEGLAISPNGRYLFGIMQNALIQDNGLATPIPPDPTVAPNRLGLNNRILRIDLLTGRTREYVYPIDVIGSGQGANELLAINDHEFMVLERDNKVGNAAVRKSIYKIDIDGATDVSNVPSLPAGALPSNIIPVGKSLFINIIDDAYGLKPTIPEKIEGMAWGPDVRVPGVGIRHTLYVTTDNDLIPANATQIYAFGIDPDLIDYQPQLLLLPIYPPWLVPRN